MEKLSLKQEVLLKFLLAKGSNDPMSSFFPARIRTLSHIISFPPSGGWLASVEYSNMQIRGNMLNYLTNLLDDTNDKASHAVLLCRMEQAKIKSWADTEKIDCVRRALAQKHGMVLHRNARNNKKNGNMEVTPCVFLQQRYLCAETFTRD